MTRRMAGSAGSEGLEVLDQLLLLLGRKSTAIELAVRRGTARGGEERGGHAGRNGARCRGEKDCGRDCPPRARHARGDEPASSPRIKVGVLARGATCLPNDPCWRSFCARSLSSRITLCCFFAKACTFGLVWSAAAESGVEEKSAPRQSAPRLSICPGVFARHRKPHSKSMVISSKRSRGDQGVRLWICRRAGSANRGHRALRIFWK